MATTFWTYYVISVFYCIYQLSKRWKQSIMPGGLGVTPALDTVMVLFIGPFLAPVDFFLTWVRLYKDAEQARRDNQKNY
jgi:hypothetical protein